MLNRKLTRRERILAAVTVAFVLGSVLYLAVLEPAVMKWRAVSAVRDGKVMEFERSVRMADASEAIERRFQDAFGVGLSLDEAVNALMGDVRERAGRSERITGMRPASPSQREAFTVAKAQVEFEGTMSDTVGFLHRIERGPGGLWIERCQLSPVGKGSNLLRGTIVVCKASAASFDTEAVR
jgi:hypothetical protein